MATEDDGGSAFPGRDALGYRQAGMTLRDYFAAAALTSIVGVYDAEDTAYHAYAMADAMLVERAK